MPASADGLPTEQAQRTVAKRGSSAVSKSVWLNKSLSIPY